MQQHTEEELTDLITKQQNQIDANKFIINIQDDLLSKKDNIIKTQNKCLTFNFICFMIISILGIIKLLT